MKVWLLHVFDYGNSEVIGAYAHRESAERAMGEWPTVIRTSNGMGRETRYRVAVKGHDFYSIGYRPTRAAAEALAASWDRSEHMNVSEHEVQP